MHKEMIISTILVLLIAISDIITQNYTKNTLNYITGELENLKQSLLEKSNEKANVEIDKIDNNGAFIKPSWYEYNAEIIETYTHNNHSVDIAKSIYNIKFLTGIKSDSGILGFQRLIGTRKNYEKLNQFLLVLWIVY